MAARLRLILRRIPWFLLAKSIFAGIFLLLAPFWAAALWAAAFYLRAGSRRFWLVFYFLFALALAYSLRASGLPILIYGSVALFAAALFLLLGIKELFFLYRPRAFAALSALLFLEGAVYFFLNLNVESTSSSLLVFSLPAIIFFREFYLFLDESRPARAMLLALPSALIFLELAWAAALLPIGFLNQAALLFAAFSILAYSFMDCLLGALSPRRILAHMAVLALAFALILALSRWSA